MALTITITPGIVLVAGQRVSIADLNALANPTVELEGSIGTASIGDGSVTLAKLAVGILSADSAGRSRMADGFMTTAKYGDASITAPKLDESARGGVYQYAAGTYATDTLPACKYTMSLTTAPTVYTAGMRVRFKADAANTGAVDVNVNSVGEVNLWTLAGKELLANQIPAGAIVDMVYDGTRFLCDLPSRYEVLAASAVSLPAAGGLTQFAHGLGVKPWRYEVVLYCETNDAASGYVTGDEIPFDSVTGASVYPVFTTYADATNISVRRNSSAVLQFLTKGGGVSGTSPTSAANFKLIARAEL